jgi:hypothetical protein
MAEQGGYRKPNTPAAVSGPGKFSKRTDGQPGVTTEQAKRYIGGGEYGTNKAFNEEVVAAAPLNAAPAVPTTPTGIPMTGMLQSNTTPLSDLFGETERPDEPPTAGVDFGDGPGSEVLKYKKEQALANDADRQRAADVLRLLESVADREDVSNSTRQTIRKLRGIL